MSSYRDDVNEVAVATATSWARVRTIAESTARGRDILLLGLGLLTIETAVATDQVRDRMHTVLTESAVASDHFTTAATLRVLVVEQGRGADAILGRTRAVIVEEAAAFDSLTSGAGQLVLERGRAADTITAQRTHRQTVGDTGKARDVLIGIQRQLVLEQGRAGSAVLDRAHARSMVLESGAAADSVIDAVVARSVVLVERGRGAGEALGRLHAADLVEAEQAVAWDELVQQGALIGQAWTAHADGWAMSRYAPFGFTGLSVIGGTVYATGPDGVYALDGGTEAIEARMQTGRVDMTGSTLANLVESHVEYELVGKAWMDVTQTQPGRAAKTYAYPLNARPSAAALTNARFVFGRGLSGRHFAYTLRLTGQSAYINDWTVLALPSKRSI